MNYLKAVLKKDHETKIKELKNLIILGEKLNKDTTPDKKKLEILQERYKAKTSNIGKKIPTVTEKKSFIPNKTNEKNYIQSIYTVQNKIVINYNKELSKDEKVRFFELKQKNTTKDVYDLNGNYPFAKTTKLKLKGVDKIVVGQFKPYTLRIVLSNKKNLVTNYSISKKQIIIEVGKKANKPSANVKSIIKKEKVKKQTTTPAVNKYIDKTNSIRTLYTKENQIIVEFNKNISKKDINYVAYKSGGSYQDIFNIKGKFKYAKPIKLKMNGLDKISVGQKDSRTLRVRISNKKDIRVIYIIQKRKLIIKVLGLTTNTNKSSKPAIPSFRKDKVVVIDAGHGAKDVGAVGPNKRYEKVVTLKVSKYLYSMLKQRGYKVFLTRHTDTFIKVNHRTVLANKKNADIFLSIHANSVPKSKAHRIHGIETFFLSPARSERAKRVAAKENKSDVRSMSRSTKAAFLESLNRPRITASHKLAIDTQAGMLESVRKSYKDVRDSGVREGPFWVLVGAQMPSILIELGYMSHPKESVRLYSSKYQRLLANGIANGIDSYFSKNP